MAIRTRQQGLALVLLLLGIAFITFAQRVDKRDVDTTEEAAQQQAEQQQAEQQQAEQQQQQEQASAGTDIDCSADKCYAGCPLADTPECVSQTGGDKDIDCNMDPCYHHCPPAPPGVCENGKRVIFDRDLCEKDPCAKGCPNADNAGLCSPSLPRVDCVLNPCFQGCPDADDVKKCPRCEDNPCFAGCPNADNKNLCPTEKAEAAPPTEDCERDPCNVGCPNADNKDLCPDCKATPCHRNCPLANNHKRCPQIVPGASITSLTVAEVTQIVRQHNRARRLLGLPLLEWDVDLSEAAQLHANKCVFKHTNALQRAQEYSQRSGQGLTGLHVSTVGENIVADTAKEDKAKLNIDAIFHQGLNWNCRTNKCKSKGCGTFLQAVYEEATRVGCGYRLCETGSPFRYSTTWNNLVCWYNPMIPSKARPFPVSQCNEARQRGVAQLGSRSFKRVLLK